MRVMTPIGDPIRGYRAARVWTLDSDAPLADHVVGVDAGGRIAEIAPAAEARVADVEDLGDVDLAPGFVDAQVNGGGGVLLNDAPTPDTIRAIAAAHRRFGTTALLPTLITDRADVMRAAREAVDACIAAGEPGVAGAHFEGPFLDAAKRGAHPEALVRDVSDADLDALFGAAPRGATLVTASPARLAGGALERILERGAVVALGHADATYEAATDAFERGARGVTHLFNAMSGLHHRLPGLVGAALASPEAFAGLILDGVHVADGAALAAYRAMGADRLFLVTDAVHPVGTDMTEFSLGGQRVQRDGLRCLNEEGNLAGSALDMASAVRRAVHALGIPLGEALRMASLTPARFLGLEGDRGALRVGHRADLVALGPGLEVARVV